MAPRPPAIAQVPAPLVPPLKDNEALVNYLRTFSLWCTNLFSDRLPASQAVPSLLLMQSDAAAGVTPKVFMLTVDGTGALHTTAVPLGSGKP